MNNAIIAANAADQKDLIAVARKISIPLDEYRSRSAAMEARADLERVTGIRMRIVAVWE